MVKLLKNLVIAFKMQATYKTKILVLKNKQANQCELAGKYLQKHFLHLFNT